MDEVLEKILPIYNEALTAFKSRNFELAKQKFQECLEIRPEDGPSKMYVERCQEFIDNPPNEDWDGAFTMTTK
jgi:hypothetical protein